MKEGIFTDAKLMKFSTTNYVLDFVSDMNGVENNDKN